MLDLADARGTEVADGEVDTVVGLAWRERDTVHAARLRRIVDRLRPRDGALPYIG